MYRPIYNTGVAIISVESETGFVESNVVKG